MKTIKSPFAQALRRIRTEKGFKQKRLEKLLRERASHEANIPINLVSLWERDARLSETLRRQTELVVIVDAILEANGQLVACFEKRLTTPDERSPSRFEQIASFMRIGKVAPSATPAAASLTNTWANVTGRELTDDELGKLIRLAGEFTDPS